jgi:uncharacterized protein (DUF1810 family)
MSDPYNLARFLSAQEPVVDTVLAELRAGGKRSHWMWFVFPQLAGLGSSAMAQRYAIASLDEAEAYLAHPVLGARLRECCSVVAGLDGLSAKQIFGEPDDMKFRSSLTLFAQVASEEALFEDCLHKYFYGVPDKTTLALIKT